METRTSAVPTSIHVLKCSIVAGEEDWRIDDITLGSSGNIAVCGINKNTDNEIFVRVYSADESDLSDKPRILYERTNFKNFLLLTQDDSLDDVPDDVSDDVSDDVPDYVPDDPFSIATVLPWEPPLCISFMKLNYNNVADEILVTGMENRIFLHDYNQGVIVRSYTINSLIQSLSVVENQIFIGLKRSNIVKIYNEDFEEIKSVVLKGIRDTPREIMAITDRLYVCVSGYMYGRAFVYSQDGGKTLTEYTSGQDHTKVWSVAVSVQLGVVAVLWSQNVIFFYPASENKSFLTVNVDPGVSRIRLSDQGWIVTGNEDTGEVKLYYLAQVYSYAHLKAYLASQLTKADCESLMSFMELPKDDINTVTESDTAAENFLLTLEEKGLIQPSDISKLLEAFLDVKATSSFYNAAVVYQKSRMQATAYGRFVATLSSHLTATLPADLCDYLNVSEERKNKIISSQNPGLSLLLELDEMKIIKPSDVRALERPFKAFQLVQARAKLDEYHTQVREEALQFELLAKETFEEKVKIFVQILQSKIKSWYETMTPVPWKKSCKWKSSDLFVSSSLILTDSKTKTDQRDIDPNCKLQYQDVLIHERVKSEKRLILEGEPGCGKTMLSSQLAYDWSQGKYKTSDVLVFLPLKFVQGMRLVTAIRKFYMGNKVPAIDDDIDAILNNANLSTVILLDGLEEYNSIVKEADGKPSEVHEIMSKAKYPSCTVVLTSRSDYAHDLPVCPKLKLGRFDEAERNEYIKKVFKDHEETQHEMKRVIEDTPFMLDICSVPLLFVLTVHNIERMAKSQREQINRVTPFMDMMVEILSPPFYGKDKDTTLDVEYKPAGLSLEELAYNGLCKGFQQLSWPKGFMDENIENVKDWIDSGILVVEEGVSEVINDERGNEWQLQEKSFEEGEAPLREKKNVPSSVMSLNPYIARVSDVLPHVTSQQERHRKHKKDTISDSNIFKLLDRIERLQFFEYDIVPRPRIKRDNDIIKQKAYSSFSLSDFAFDTNAEMPSKYEKEEKHYRDKSRRSSGITKTDLLHRLNVSKTLLKLYGKDKDTTLDVEYEPPLLSLEELASNGPCKGFQQLSWPKGFMDENIENVKDWIDSGILVAEEGVSEVINDEREMPSKYEKEEKHYRDKSRQSSGITKTDLLHQLNVSKTLLKWLEEEGGQRRTDDSNGSTKASTKTLSKSEAHWEQGSEKNQQSSLEKSEFHSEKTSKQSASALTSKIVPLRIKFVHKVFQEWFAAKFLSCVIWSKNVRTFKEYLSLIDPIDLHYVLRFTCHLCPSSCCVVLSHLQNSYRSKEGGVPHYILDCMSLCYAEYDGYSGDDIKMVVREMCKETFKIQHIDSRVLQQSKIALLKFASQSGIPILKVQLLDVVTTVGEKLLTFNTGATMDILDTLQVIEVSRWDQKLTEEDYANVVNFIARSKSVTKASLFFPNRPPKLQPETLAVIASKEIKVEWRIGTLVQTLDSSTGLWPVLMINPSLQSAKTGAAHSDVATGVVKSDSFKEILGNPLTQLSPQKLSTTPSTQLTQKTLHQQVTKLPEWSSEVRAYQQRKVVDSNKDDEVVGESRQALEYRELLQRPLPETEEAVSTKSVTMTIPDTKIVLNIPSNALPEHASGCIIKMRLLPRKVFIDPASTFASHSCVVVELLPNNLILQHPVQLTIPHCLLLKKNKAPTAKIYMSHHQEGSPPCWEEHSDLEYCVESTRCIVWLNTFCWVTIKVDDKDVLAKHLILYSCGKKLLPAVKYALTAVGYYPDLDGEQKFLKLNKTMIVSERIPFVFMKEGSHPLTVSLVKHSDNWEHWSPQDHLDIAFEDISSSFEHICKFVFEKRDDSAQSLMCLFQVFQEKGQQAINLTICPERLDSSQGFDSQMRDSSTQTQEITPGTGIKNTATVYDEDFLHIQSEERQGELHKKVQENLILTPKLDELQQGTSQGRSTMSYGTRDSAVRPKIREQRKPNEKRNDIENNTLAIYHPHGACQEEVEDPRQLTPFGYYVLSQHMRVGLQPWPFHNPFQQTFYNQCLQSARYGPMSGTQYCMHEDSPGQGGSDLRYGVINAISKKLDRKDPLGNDWRRLADTLGFSMDDITALESAPSSTFAVIDCAIKSGKLQSLDQLKGILIRIGRSDAASIIQTEEST